MAAPQAVRPTLALTVGEPSGIGPEISIRAAWGLREAVNCVLVGDAAFLALTASLVDPSIRLSALSVQALRNGGLPHFGKDRIAVV
ncbi:MAG TPA: 4-hydroxythreonine-4-phosphate dehydrogenase, partial [Massilia sp.]|nr:4-hydroxythreonine-4-phosphate dehydrogenase [Massilia sp.]